MNTKELIERLEKDRASLIGAITRLTADNLQLLAALKLHKTSIPKIKALRVAYEDVTEKFVDAIAAVKTTEQTPEESNWEDEGGTIDNTGQTT